MSGQKKSQKRGKQWYQIYFAGKYGMGDERVFEQNFGFVDL